MSSITFPIYYYHFLLLIITIDLLGCPNTFIFVFFLSCGNGEHLEFEVTWTGSHCFALCPLGSRVTDTEGKASWKGGSSRSNVHSFTSANPASFEAASGRSELCASHLTRLIFTWLFPGQRQIVSKSMGKFTVSLRTNVSRPWVLLPEELLCRLPGESPGGVLGVFLGESSWVFIGGSLPGWVFLGDSSCQWWVVNERGMLSSPNLCGS